MIFVVSVVVVVFVATAIIVLIEYGSVLDFDRFLSLI